MRLLVLVFCSLGITVTGIHDPLQLGSYAYAGSDKASKRAQRQLANGRKSFENQDYKKTIRRLRRVADNDAASTAQRTAALELIGLSQFILGQRDAAKETFLELVVLEPGYELQDDFDSEEIRTAFQEVKRDFLENNAPAQLSLRKVVRATAGKRLTIDVQVDVGAEQVKAALAFARPQGTDDYAAVEMTPMGDGRWRARIPTKRSGKTYVLEYYVEARDIGGSPNARLGSPSSPRTLDIAGHRPTPWYRRWYTIAGTIALAGVTTAVVLTLTKD